MEKKEKNGKEKWKSDKKKDEEQRRKIFMFRRISNI